MAFCAALSITKVTIVNFQGVNAKLNPNYKTVAYGRNQVLQKNRSVCL